MAAYRRLETEPRRTAIPQPLKKPDVTPRPYPPSNPIPTQPGPHPVISPNPNPPPSEFPPNPIPKPNP